MSNQAIALVQKIDWLVLLWKVGLAIVCGWVISSTAIDMICIWAHDYYEALIAIRNELHFVSAVLALAILLWSARIGCVVLPLLLASVSFAIVAGYHYRREDTEYEIYSIASVYGYTAVITLVVFLGAYWWNERRAKNTR